MYTKTIQTAPPQFIKSSLPSLLLRPVANTDEIVEAWQKYQELKTRLLTTQDYQLINGKNFIKKSGWRKLATAFGISDEIIKEKRKEYGKYFVYETTARASAANGRSSYGVGSCSSSERRFSHPEHDVRSISATRSKNRAISDLIGGEVSADEIVSEPATEIIEEVIPFAENDNNSHPQKVYGRQWEESSPSEKQIRLATTLIKERYSNPDEMTEQLTALDGLSKYDCSQLISQLINS